jgi:L-lactate dehydrogenase complex protein LldE
MNIQIFIPCFVDQLFPSTAFNMIRVLEKFGCTVHYNPNQTCCGQPAFNAGYRDEATAIAKKFENDFSQDMPIVSPSGSCTGFVRNYHHKLLPDGKFATCEPTNKKIYEFTEFLIEVLGVIDSGASLDGKAAYHDACGALRECGIKQAPRILLSSVKGLNIQESDDCEVCCGFGGTFAVKYEAISVGMAEQKVLNALKSGAEYIISTDISCLMHMEGYIQQHNYPIKTLHIADVLSSGW